MRVLLINELYTMGGSEIQTLREKAILRANGHDVWHLTFDKTLSYEIDPDDNQHINIAPTECVSFGSKVKNFLYKWMKVDPKYVKRLQDFFHEVSPDVIHLNVNNYKQISLYKAIEPYAAVQTIRDFSSICPTRICIWPNLQQCDGFCHEKCLKKCMPNGSLRGRLRFCLLYYNVGLVKRARMKAINQNLCPSQFLTTACNNNGIETQCVNNSFDFSILDNFQKENDDREKVYLVYGVMAPHKGTRQIIDAFNRFSENRNVRLLLVGKVLDDFKIEFQELIGEKKQITYLGIMSYSETISLLQYTYAVVVPSLWIENYPNTALEGLATECLVLGSNRGGIPELIQDSRFVFDVLSQEDIINKLELSYNLPKDEYIQIVKGNKKRIEENNSIHTYYKRIISVFERISG